MVLLKILAVVLVLLFPLGELGRINIYNEVSATINDILVAVVVFVWLVWVILRKKFFDIPKKQLVKPIIFFIFFAFLSLLFNYNSFKSSEFIISFLYLLRFAFYAGIYFVISGFDLNFKRIIIILMIISGTLIVLGGFIQYFFYPNLRNLYYLGWDEHLYRLFSSFLDPNFAASVISLHLILVLSVLLTGFNIHVKIRRSGLERKHSVRSLTRVSKQLEILDTPFGLTRMTQGMFLVLISIFAFIALLLTYSRSGYLMFSISALVLLIILGKKKYIPILILIFAVGIILVPKDLGGEGVKLLRTASFISRTEYANNAIIIFKDNPILGVGFNSYRYAQHRYGFIDDLSLRTSHAGAGTDNSFLFVLATTGVVGFAFYLYMWFKILRKAHRDYVISNARERSHGILRHSPQNDRKYVSAIIMASSIGLFVNALFLNTLFYPPIMLWMWVLIGLNPSAGSGSRESK